MFMYFSQELKGSMQHYHHWERVLMTCAAICLADSQCSLNIANLIMFMQHYSGNSGTICVVSWKIQFGIMCQERTDVTEVLWVTHSDLPLKVCFINSLWRPDSTLPCCSWKSVLYLVRLYTHCLAFMCVCVRARLWIYVWAERFSWTSRGQGHQSQTQPNHCTKYRDIVSLRL